MNLPNNPVHGSDSNEKNSPIDIFSKSGFLIQIDVINSILTIITPDKNQVILSDKEKKLTIEDANQNSIVLSADGITMHSLKDIKISADQKVRITGKQGITIESSAGDIAISGMNISEKAQEEYSAEGSMNAKIKSGMELTLKSAMILIN